MDGINYQRYFTKNTSIVESMFTWTARQVEIKEGAQIVFSGEIEAPEFWSDLAVAISAKTWFRVRKHPGEQIPRRENSIKDMICRVVDAIAEASKYPNVGTDYFGGNEEKRKAFRDELFYICSAQFAMFNTPVWVNVGIEQPKHHHIDLQKKKSISKQNQAWGVYGKQDPNKGPQASACFILSADDSMEALTQLQQQETMLFRHGSGTGTNISSLRPANSALSTGGTASGAVSFMRGFDAWAGITKSGGKSRRAAKMVVLDVYHPDIQLFIKTKVTAQKMIRDLGKMGWDTGFNEIATSWIPYQNANNSVRVDDAFMKALTQQEQTHPEITLHWPTQWNKNHQESINKTSQEVIFGPTIDAYSLLKEIALSAHDCGDPGLQYDTTINHWHTCKSSGRIYASNPCSEYMFLQDSACNLASLRLTKFITNKPDNFFDITAFEHVAQTMFIAQEVLVGAAGYPTEKVAKNSHNFRPLGLGYADLGALLMRLGIAYDSSEGRTLCAAITALLGGTAYQTSALLSKTCGGPFLRFTENKKEMLNVIQLHKTYVDQLATSGISIDGIQITSPRNEFKSIIKAAKKAWDEAYLLGKKYGYRNAQATVLAPTGTIGFAMDCDTTGIEPDTAIVKTKRLAGGGSIEIVNQSIPIALTHLGYSHKQMKEIVDHIYQTGGIPQENCRGSGAIVQQEHIPIFATAFGEHVISPMAHLLMMAAAQPFLSGAISKTVNLPKEATIDDVVHIYIQAWKLGLKAVAIYRDSSKDQPLLAKKNTPPQIESLAKNPQAVSSVGRRRLPLNCQSYRHKFSLGGIDGYIHLGFYENGDLGEIFVRMAPNAKSSILIDLTTQAASVAIQHGASIEGFLSKWEGTEFSPNGFTGESGTGIPWASSPLDYLAKWLRLFLENKVHQTQTILQPLENPSSTKQDNKSIQSAPPCPRCNLALRRDGVCWSCPTCGYGLGGCGG